MLMSEVNLVNSKSPQEVIQKLQQYISKKGTLSGWIKGSGWDQNLFPSKSFPDRWLLDTYFPDTPIILKRIDYHAAWCNSAALKNVQLPSEDPPGGAILRDSKGIPTGIFVDNAMVFVESQIPPLTDPEIQSYIQLASSLCVQHGITSVHDALFKAPMYRAIKKLIDSGSFPLRVYGMVHDAKSELEDDKVPEEEWKKENYRDRLFIRSIKFWLDGALGSYGAAMIQPYSDKPTQSGLLKINEKKYAERVEHWISRGWQVNTHTIGDKANLLAVTTYKKVVEKLNVDPKPLRLRVEHSQIVPQENLQIYKELDLIASVQPTHCTSDMTYAESRLGPERIKNAYRWRSFLDNNIRIAFGSDFPVEGVSPFLGLYAAITRQDLSGNPPAGWYPEERVNIREAIKAFTLDAAYAAFQENQLGSIEVGKFADFFVINEDLTTISPLLIPHIQVQATYSSGKLVYQNSKSRL
eukprot:TRINITY_DN4699_c0_g1_i2.p1 TRINITY_DN4699_c0_g1~~TRINITY_DN4699_c0_g1_i2.p1  ORF type:complete len:467 (+),score=125.52 TRINITY_DN4699_c0_g1_i2:354-1754(+)